MTTSRRRSRPGVEWFLVFGGVTLVIIASLAWRAGCGNRDPRAQPQATPTPDAAKWPVQGTATPAVIVDDDLRGGLRLEGQVIAGDESGVGGATVIISTYPPRSAVTEADGSFAFDGLLGRRYVLEAMTPEGSAGPTTVALRKDTEPVILRLRTGARVEIAVADAASGAAIRAATVALRGLSARTAVTDEQGAAGFAHVAPGRYEIAAAAPGFAPEYGAVMVEGTSTVALRLALRRGASVSGRVLGPDGAPVPGARVHHEAASELAAGPSARLDAVTTDAAGRFRFEAMRAGSFRFLARHPELAPGSSAIVRLDGKTERTDLEIRLEPGATLRVRVETRSGSAVPGAAVRVSPARASWLPAPVRQAHTDEQGELTLRALPRERLELVAVHDAGSSAAQLVDLRAPPHDQRLTLVLAHTDSIGGVVVDAAGQPVEGAQVTARVKGALELPVDTGAARLRGAAVELTDAGGRFVLGGLAPGRYELRASRRGLRSALDALRPATEASTGDTGVRLRLIPDGGITGRVAFADGTPPGPFLVALDGARPTPVVSGTGAFTLTDVPPATYRLSIRGPAFADVQRPDVAVAEGATTDVGTITVKRDGGRRVAGVVLADGAPVAGALVLVGSSILSDGTSIKMQGSPLVGASREAVTDEAGRFSIGGLRAVPLVAIAEHQARGRSSPITLDASAPVVDDVVLELRGFGSLRGKATDRGEPVRSISVGLQSMEANGLQLAATTGSDGSYEFARLAPGRYKLSAMFGGMGGMSFHGKLVAVRTGETTTADLALDRRTGSLSITVTATNAPACRFAWINVVSGVITARDAAELQAIVLRGEQAFSAFSIFSGTLPAVIGDLGPGIYTVCAIPFPKELSTQAEYSEYHERAASSLPVSCRTVELADPPPRRELTMEVPIPPFVPTPPEP